MKKIITTRFGEIEIDESQAIHFPEGLPGFFEYRDYVIMEHKPGSPFIWLQSMTSPDLAFVMTNPFLIKKDYLEDLADEEEAVLITKGEDKDRLIFAIVTIPKGDAKETTVNLLGPIVIDRRTKTARQVILANSGYSHRHPMFPD